MEVPSLKFHSCSGSGYKRHYMWADSCLKKEYKFREKDKLNCFWLHGMEKYFDQ